MVKIVGTERDFQAAVVRLAKLCRWRVYWTHDSRHSPAGWPDLVLVREPVTLFRELKRDAGPSRITPEQRETIRALQDCGLDAAFWSPEDWSEIEHVLTAKPHRSGVRPPAPAVQLCGNGRGNETRPGRRIAD